MSKRTALIVICVSLQFTWVTLKSLSQTNRRFKPACKGIQKFAEHIWLQIFNLCRKPIEGEADAKKTKKKKDWLKQQFSGI
jgi:hypothetical protein